MDINKEKILNRILGLLYDQNYTKLALTDELDIRDSSIDEWKDGSSETFMKYLPEIADFFGVAQSYLEGSTEIYYSIDGNNVIESSIDSQATIRNNIISFLNKNNISAYKLSKLTGIANSTISDWKNGRGIPSADAILKIANCFNVSTDCLLGRSNKKGMPESASLTTSQAEIVELYDSLNQEGQAQALSYLRFLKNESPSVYEVAEDNLHASIPETEVHRNKSSRK